MKTINKQDITSRVHKRFDEWVAQYVDTYVAPGAFCVYTGIDELKIEEAGGVCKRRSFSFVVEVDLANPMSAVYPGLRDYIKDELADTLNFKTCEAARSLYDDGVICTAGLCWVQMYDNPLHGNEKIVEGVLYYAVGRSDTPRFNRHQKSSPNADIGGYSDYDSDHDSWDDICGDIDSIFDECLDAPADATSGGTWAERLSDDTTGLGVSPAEFGFDDYDNYVSVGFELDKLHKNDVFTLGRLMSEIKRLVQIASTELVGSDEAKSVTDSIIPLVRSLAGTWVFEEDEELPLDDGEENFGFQL